jgi:hypothetical protein
MPVRTPPNTFFEEFIIINIPTMKRINGKEKTT